MAGGYPVGWDAQPGRRLRLYPMHSMLHTVNGMLRDTSRLWSTDRSRCRSTAPTRIALSCPIIDRPHRTNVGLGNDVLCADRQNGDGDGGRRRARGGRDGADVARRRSTRGNPPAAAASGRHAQRVHRTGRPSAPAVSHRALLSARTMERIVRDPRPATLDTETTWAMLSHAAPFGADSNLSTWHAARFGYRAYNIRVCFSERPLHAPSMNTARPRTFRTSASDHPALAPCTDRTDFLC